MHKACTRDESHPGFWYLVAVARKNRRNQRFGPEDVFDVHGKAHLPAPSATIIAALTPLISDERLGRIEGVVTQRSRTVVPVLEGLVDPHNISAILRSADAFGVQDVHVVDPEGVFKASHTVALGSERWLDVVRHETAHNCVKALKAAGYKVLVATMAGDVTPTQLQPMGKVAVVFGNEHAGVSPEMAEQADGTFTIPMRGFVESLNVSVANAITLQAATADRPGDLSHDEQQALRARFMMLSVPRPTEVIQEYERRNP